MYDMVRMKEIQVLIDSFRISVIKAILSAYSERAVDDGDPNNDTFLIDGIPVVVEGDRIIVGDDVDNYIPLKDPPIAGNPPQYRDVNSILSDFKAYVDKERREDTMIEVKINESIKIPGTNIVLEKGDKIMYKEATEVFKKSFLKKPGDMWYSKDKYWGVWWDDNDHDTLWIYHTDQWGEDYYESEALDYNGVSQIVFKGQASYSVKESVKVKESTVSDIEKILKKTGWDIEETDDDFLLAQYGDEVFSINADSGEISIGTDEGSEVIWTGSYEDFVKTYKGVKDDKILVGGKSLKAVKENVKVKESTIADIEKLLKKTGWDIEETDDDFLLAQYGDEVFSINADSGEVNIGTDEGSETIWTGSYDDFIKTYKGVKNNIIIVDNKSFKAVINT